MLITLFKKIATQFMQIGIGPDTGLEDQRKIQLMNGMSLVGISFNVTFLVQSFSEGYYVHSLVLLITFTIFISNWIFFAISQKHKPAGFILVLIFAVLLLYLLMTGGVENSGLFWYFCFAPLTMFIHGARTGSIIILTLLGISAFLLFVPIPGILYLTISMEVKLRFLATYSALFLLTLLYELSRTEAFTYLKDLSSKYEKLSQTDLLTGLLNRRGIFPLLNTQFEVARRNQRCFCVLIADIDHFKNFNDQYGHDCGDRILQMTSTQLTHSLRLQDSVARWGGEEFLILLPETNTAGAVVVSEKIRKMVEAISIEHTGEILHTTISLGGAGFSGHTTLDSIIAEADQKLYQAKNSGRNRAVI